MDLNKHLSFFNPEVNKRPIHVIGLGAIGSNVVQQLVRLGFTDLHLYDFDTVSDHNITNQTFTQEDIGKPKLTCLIEQSIKINPEIVIYPHMEGWQKGMPLSGIVILCLDKVELRKQILEENQRNFNINFVLDMRIGLESAQMYAAKWDSLDSIERIISTMQFKDSEVSVPVSACGTQLTVLPTVQGIVSLGIMNLINYQKTGAYNFMSTIDVLQGQAASY